jgi:N-acetylmuramoyl-L-alanine amidase
MYYPIDQDVPTGSIDVRELRAALADAHVQTVTSA